MKKYKDKKGKEVRLGDIYSNQETERKNGTIITKSISCLVTEESLKYLMDIKEVFEVEEDPEPKFEDEMVQITYDSLKKFISGAVLAFGVPKSTICKLFDTIMRNLEQEDSECSE